MAQLDTSPRPIVSGSLHFVPRRRARAGAIEAGRRCMPAGAARDTYRDALIEQED